MKLSTHDLTRRSTRSRKASWIVQGSFNSRPHTEVDGSRRSFLMYQIPFNSRPHTEVDKERLRRRAAYETFNSRPHTEVDIVGMEKLQKKLNFQLTTSHGGRLKEMPGLKNIQTFQLTTSHGGRQDLYRPLHLRPPFNSRPHTEVDQFLSSIGQIVYLSTHDLTRRSTAVSGSTTSVIFAFQLTTSHGGRLHRDPAGIHATDLSTHDLTRRSTRWSRHFRLG